MPEPPGRHRWVIVEGYIPAQSHGPEPQTSHETACLLNAGERDARVVTITVPPDRTG